MRQVVCAKVDLLRFENGSYRRQHILSSLAIIPTSPYDSLTYGKKYKRGLQRNEELA